MACWRSILQDRIESWNSQMEVMYALPRWQALTRPFGDFFPGGFRRGVLPGAAKPGIHNLYKFRLATPTGETRIVNVAIAPLVTKKFSVVGRLIIMDDITERVELEAQLSQADKLSSIGLLAAGVAHEVNTPLAVISSYAQMLAKQLQGDEQKGATAGQNYAADFPRVGNCQQSAEFLAHQRHRIHGSGCEPHHSRHTESAGASVQYHTDSRSGRPCASICRTIQGNAGRLQQVFLNLFLNAKDAMAEGGTLRLPPYNGEV